MSLCPFKEYKNIFGIQKKGAHSYRFLNTAIVDYISAILLACIITYLTKVPLVLTTIIVLIIGIILHTLFDVRTNVVNYLSLECE